MSFEEMLTELKKVPRQELRVDTEKFFEIVISKIHLDVVTALLQRYFGSPMKPPGQAPSAKDLQYSGPYGGVHTEQTLYYRENKSGSEVVLLWPWGGGQTITFKLICIKNTN